MYWTFCLEGGLRRVNHAAAAVDGFIYSFGGYSLGENFNEFRPMDIHVLNPGNLRWHRLPSPTYAEYQINDRNIPFKRYGHTAVTYGKKIYIWGGRNEETVCNRVFIFDTETLTWSKPTVSGVVPVARDGHTACIIQDRMYVFGGFVDEIERFSNDVYYLDLRTNRWHYVVAHGQVKFRDFHSASAIGSYMYVFGGRGDLNGPYNSHNECYCSEIVYLDTESNQWMRPITTGDIPRGRRSHSSFVVNGMLYIFGGFNGLTDEHFNDLHRFNPLTREWKRIYPHGKPPILRRRQSCIAIGDKVYIFGGTSPCEEVLGAAYSNDQGSVQVLGGQNQFHLHLDNINHNDNIDEENDNPVNIIIEQGPDQPPLIFPNLIHHLQDELNQNENMDQEDDDEFSVDDNPKLFDLNDLHILDLSPSLYTLCLKAVIDYKLEISGLPEIVRRELYFLTTPNSITQ